jgi:serine/threonine protein kinase
MSYLIPEEFESRYPQGNFLSSGSYGRVYLSGADSVIKEIGGKTALNSFNSSLKELNVYSHVDHPCVVRMKNWTYENNTFKIALPLGVTPKDAVMRGDLNFFQALSDLLSGMVSVYEVGLAHNDIKSANTIYHEGHLKLIDFGLATPVRSYLNAYTAIDALQTVDHRDPYVNYDNESDLRIELYAVAGILAELFLNVYPFYNYPLPPYISFGDSVKDSIYRDLVRYPLTDRLNIYDFFKKYPMLTLYSGTILETPAYPLTNCLQDVLVSVYDWVLALAQKAKMKTQSFFLCLHLFRRSLPVIFPNYFADPNAPIKVQSLAGVCFILSNIILDDEIVMDFTDVANLSQEQYSWQQVRDMALEVIIRLRGIILTDTPWNYATNVRNLGWGYYNLLRCNYEPGTTTSIKDGKDLIDKSLPIEDFSEILKQSFGSYDLEYLLENFPLSRISRNDVPVRRNFIDRTLSYRTVLFSIYRYNSIPSPVLEDIYQLGSVLHFDYSNASSSEINDVLQNLRRTLAGRKYAQIIETQILVNSPVMIL